MADAPRDLPDVERRLRATESVQQVMQAVWALARGQQPLVEEAAAEAASYLAWMEDLVDRLVGAAPPTDEQQTLWVVLGPERPFCGPLGRMLVDQVPPTGGLALVGARLVEAAEQDPALMRRVRFHLPGPVTPDEIPGCAERIARQILAEVGDGQVVLLHPIRGAPRLEPSMLLAGERPHRPAPPTLLSAVETVLTAAVLELVAGRLAMGLAESLRAEVRARLAAADAARRACDRQLDELRQAWRVLRQGTITQELIELTSGRRRPRPPS